MSPNCTAILTVAIPTFNRNEILKRNLRLFLPHLTPQCKLLILDNCSEVPVADTLAHLWAEYPDVQCEIVRHRVNIGGSANVVRCFELCDTEWVWVLGDDDEVHAEALPSVLRAIAVHGNAVSLNWSSSFGRRQHEFKTKGMAGFIGDADFLGNSIFISTNVYSARKMKPFCRFGLHYAYSTAPHLVMLLEALRADPGSECWFFSEEVVTWCPCEAAQRWSWLVVAMGLMTLCELEMTHPVRRILARKLAASGLTLRNLANYILLDGVARNDPAGARYLFDQASYRYLYLAGRFHERVMRPLYRLMFLFPKCGAYLERAARFVLGRKPAEYVRSRDRI